MLTSEIALALDYFDSQAVSSAQVQKAENMTFEQLRSKVDAGTFPMPAGSIDQQEYWRLGDVVRWRYGWA